MNRTVPWALAPALLFAVVACGAAQPAPIPPTAAAQPSSEPPAPAPDAYSPYADPSFLKLQNEKNVYVRRTLSLLWLESAKADPPGAARDARQTHATQALSEAEAAVAAQGDPCKGGVLAAIERATADKGQLERRYLAVSETEGENSDDAKAIDVQVHVLRDVIDELGVLAKPCPAAMFPDSDYEPR